MARDQWRVWSRIAASFDASRQRTWPHVEAYLDGLADDARVLDLMAGNGRHTRSAAERGLDVVALDWSPGLASAAATHGPAIIGDATRLPTVDGAFDACTYVAGLHGIPSPDGRLASWRELFRVLRPGGTAQVTVWSREAPRFRAEGTPGRPVDVNIPWRSGGHDEDRFYHLYTLDALVEEAEAAGFEVLEAGHVAVVAKEERTWDNEAVTVRRPTATH